MHEIRLSQEGLHDIREGRSKVTSLLKEEPDLRKPGYGSNLQQMQPMCLPHPENGKDRFKQIWTFIFSEAFLKKTQLPDRKVNVNRIYHSLKIR